MQAQQLRSRSRSQARAAAQAPLTPSHHGWPTGKGSGPQSYKALPEHYQPLRSYAAPGQTGITSALLLMDKGICAPPHLSSVVPISSQKAKQHLPWSPEDILETWEEFWEPRGDYSFRKHLTEAGGRCCRCSWRPRSGCGSSCPAFTASAA